jgi:peptidoglycan/LPS O-acetylase OafA/YrhL
MDERHDGGAHLRHGRTPSTRVNAMRRPDRHPARGRIPPLDGLRGFAALVVIVYHVVHTTAPGLLTLNAPHVIAYPLNDLGTNAVMTFFVLSGFLISLPFVGWLLGVAGPVDPWRYVRSRVLRIYPAWLLVITVVAALSAGWVFEDPGRLALLWTLQQNYDPHLLRKIVPPGWSLVIEVSFYAALPIIAFAAAPLVRRLGFAGRAVAVAVGGLALAAASIAFQWWWIYDGQVPRPDLRPPTFSLLAWGDTFAFGSVAACAYLVLHHRGRRPWWWVLPLAGVGIGVAGLEWYPIYRHQWAAIAAALVVLGLATAPSAPVARVFNVRPLREVGRLSYGVYLWHLPLLYAGVTLGIVDHGHVIQTIPVLLVITALALVCAEISWRLVEQPLLRVAHSSRGRGKQAAAAAPARA